MSKQIEFYVPATGNHDNTLSKQQTKSRKSFQHTNTFTCTLLRKGKTFIVHHRLNIVTKEKE